MPHLGGFLDYLQAECGLSANTRLAYQRDLRRFWAFLYQQQVTELSALTPRHVEGFVRHCIEAGLCAASASRALAAVRMLCRYLVLQNVLAQDVSATVEAPKSWHRLPTVLDEPTAANLVGSPAAVGGRLSLRDRALLTLLYATGLRASELAGLCIGDVNANLRVLRVTGKGGKERIVPVADEAMALLREYVHTARGEGSKAQDRVFVSRTGKPLAREDVFRIVRKYVRASGTRGHVSPHTLRHCFATHMLSGGADLRIVQELLGHADIATTQIYTHVDADRLRSVHRQFHPRG